MNINLGEWHVNSINNGRNISNELCSGRECACGGMENVDGLRPNSKGSNIPGYPFPPAGHLFYNRLDPVLTEREYHVVNKNNGEANVSSEHKETV